MSEQMSEIACSAELPDDWFGLPMEEDSGEFGRRFAEIITRDLRDELQIELASEQTADMAADITQCTGDAQEKGAAFAAVYMPDLTQPIVAMLECLVVDPADVGWSGDPDALVQQMRAEDTMIAWGEVTRVDLPAGPAVRVHDISAPPAEDPADRRPAVEKVMHLLAWGNQVMVVLNMTWAALALTDELTPMADAIAQTLEVAP